MNKESTPSLTNPLGRMKKYIFIYPSTPVDFKFPHFIVGNARYHKDWYDIRYHKEDI